MQERGLSTDKFKVLSLFAGIGGFDLGLKRTGGFGVPDRLDRIAALGNAVVPQIPELIGRAILAAEGRKATSTPERDASLSHALSLGGGSQAPCAAARLYPPDHDAGIYAGTEA